ncbi:unnamed protein product [Hanseniaspora opuntiae]|uniref:Ankyrin repeat-containing protein YAR1 n=1 Tax=Hanseniaspora opuntiae TaxID=211096 RepID=A0A1E5RL02_9ASCO|nr:Ankyrin repeat-containing protein YAR1 [Hanseniaspora opuntiae]
MTEAKIDDTRFQKLDDEDKTSVVLDARYGDLDSLKEIFEEMIDSSLLITDNIVDDNKNTPLHMAACNGHLDIIKYLMGSLKSNDLITDEQIHNWVSSKNGSGNTALHWATLTNQLEVIKYLCEEWKADPLIKNNLGQDCIFVSETNQLSEIEAYYLTNYEVEPEDESDDEGDAEDVKFSSEDVEYKEGTEINEMTKDANEALKNMDINKE